MKMVHRKRSFPGLFFLMLKLCIAVSAFAQTAGDTQAILVEVSQLMARRDYPAALALFDNINQSSLQTAEIQLLKASVLNSAGRTAEARTIANGIISRNANNIDALLVLAASAAIEGKDREQRTFLERIVRIDPQNTKALSDLGYIALRVQSMRIAAGHFDAALAVDPDHRESMVGRAIVYRYAGDPRRAEQLLNRAIQQNPQ
ncbi:MAG: tetratricopeptide repeat protein, partial [Treponema sp.]|nr:tetratricopeptide repeat protein [Treponema sp.]